MGFRWHKSWLLASFICGCALNPQPDLPGDRGSDNGSGGSLGIAGAAGSPTGIIVGPSAGPADSADAGAPIGLPDAGIQEGGAGGALGEAGAPSEGGRSGGGDAPGEGGLAGETDAGQLAPGRAK